MSGHCLYRNDLLRGIFCSVGPLVVFPGGVFRHMGRLFCWNDGFYECSFGIGYCCVVSFGGISSGAIVRFV